MTTPPLPTNKTSQVTLSQLKSQQETIEQWANQQAKLRRFQLNFPDLSNSFDPQWAELSKVLRNLCEFEENRGGLSPNTLSMLAFVVNKWDQHCKSIQAYSFPIHPPMLLTWFKSLKLKHELKINTLKQYRAQLSLFHKLMGVEDTTKASTIVTFFKSLAKDEMELTGSQVIELQAKPFRKAHLEPLMKHWGDEKQALSFRDLTVLTIAYGTLLREGEIGKIRKKHINIIENGDINIERVTSKTSITPEPKRLTGRFSEIVIKYLKLYCHDLGEEDFIFCWLTVKGARPKKYRQTPMSGMTIDRIYRRAHDTLHSEEINLDQGITHRKVWSGHSSRVGALQDGYKTGLSLTQLIQLGDWKSNEMVLRYLRGLNNDQSPNLVLQAD
ncbi:tyrosine-type recombinase/integrase [Vibrio alfacsensis]|uniref:tyrosine-type recombinase/integrase n=1 Tax=Vibrio alfacsensis TaxID=1074311 RepID=UPI0040689D94